MINLEIGELYGMKSERELMQAIQLCRSIGMSDEEIQAVLDRSKEEDKNGDNTTDV